MANQKISDLLKRQIARNNLIEALGSEFGDFGRDVKKQVKTNVHDSGSDILTQVAGVKEKPSLKKSGELKPGQEIDLKSHSQKESPKAERKVAAMNYHAEISRNSESSNNRKNREVEAQIQQIMAELQRLVSSTSEVMKMQYADISVGQAPKNVGKYHVNFFSWMLNVIQTTRQKVEDSGAWLQVAKRKGGLIQNAWKKGDTSVTMSTERQVATQVG